MTYFLPALISLAFLTISGSQAQAPVSGEDYSQRGIARFEKNDFDGAISDFTKAIELKGANLEFCYYFRGMAEYHQGNLDVAIADIGKAITIRPHPRFYEDRGSLLLKKGDLDGAIADLSKTIELAPQFAKAYGDRGIVHLMRGENAQAELDFKKCFELDNTLRTQIDAAASQIKQHAASHHEPEQPADVKVVKFSWSDMPAVMIGSPPSTIEVTSTAVSATGTRVLADPSAKNGPERPDMGLDPRPSPSDREPGNSRKSAGATFTVVIQNVGNKTIVGVKWKYFFYPKDITSEPIAFTFNSKTKIAPGKEKMFSEQGNVITEPGHRIQMPTYKTQMLFNERVAIFHLDYADGTVWPSPQP
jgi:Tfp pilus assembly protein PilF